MKKVCVFLVVCVLVIGGIFACLKFTKNGKENEQSKSDESGIDYLVLVNKKNQLPDDWESKVQLITVKDAWGDDIKVEKEAYEKYKELKSALEKEEVYIELDSCYRSVSAQKELWDRWTVEKGIDYVRTYVAVPGFSEHHTGLALDICIKVNGELIYENEDMIAEKDIFSKIHAKLGDYGFILRYPEDRDDITGYAYEPWHLRYVGSTEIANKIMKEDITFEEYLGSIKNIKETPAAAKYQLQKTLDNYVRKAYGDKITNCRFNIKKIYSDEEVKNDSTINSLNLGKNDIAFEVGYQLQPAEGIDINELLISDGEYDKDLGWVVNINRLGVLRFDESKGTYSIDNFGTGW